MGRPSNAELAARAAAATPQGEQTVAAAVQESVPLNLNDDVARIRALREKQPFGAFAQKLDLPPIEGYAQHWFSDKPGRIELALRAGWTHTTDEAGKPISQMGGSDGVRLYAMKIPQQFRDEDTARENAKAAAALAAVKKKPAQSGAPVQASDAGAFYTPNPSGDAVSVTRSNNR